MHMKERAAYRCGSKKCGYLSSTKLPRVRLPVFSKRDIQTSDDAGRSPASSQQRASQGSQAGSSNGSGKTRNSAFGRRPAKIKRQSSYSNLMSQTLLSVAAKLEKVFNSSEARNHKVKRVYVIRFDDKNNSNLKNRRKKYTRILCNKKPGGKGSPQQMDRATLGSPNRARCSSSGSEEGAAELFSIRNDRSGDVPDTFSPDYSQDDDDEARNRRLLNRLPPELASSRITQESARRIPLFQENRIADNAYSMAGQGYGTRNPKIDQIADIFGAILKEIENVSPSEGCRARSPKKKTLSEIIESDESLVSAEYTIPPSMITKEAVDALQALIEHNSRPRRRGRNERTSWSTQRSLNRQFSSTEWHRLRQPLNFQAEVISEADYSMARSSSSGTGPICRICHERLGTLVRPCRCRGSMAYVHVECLQMWLTEKDIDFCELCRYKFRVIHVPEYRLVPSIGFWYKFAATNQQRKRILIDLTLAVVLLPVLIFVTLFARSCSAEYPTLSPDLDDDVEYVLEDKWTALSWFLLVYAFRFFTFLLNMFYVGTVVIRINHHLAAWLSWYVNKNVTVVLEDRHPGSARTVGTGDDLNQTSSEYA